MKRLIEKIVSSGFVTCCRRAGAPTSRWPSFVNATTDGVVRPPSAFGITTGSPPSRTAMHEFVVPRSIPVVFAMRVYLLMRKSKSHDSRFGNSLPEAYVQAMVERKDIEAALEARRELGQEYEPQIVDSLAEKIERRLEERLRERRAPAPRHHYFEMRLALGSIGLGIGATAVATSNAQGAGGIVIASIAWIAIAVVNIVYAVR